MRQSLLRKLLLTITGILLLSFVVGQVLGHSIMQRWFLNDQLEQLVPRMLKMVEEIKVSEGSITIEGEPQLVMKAYDLDNHEMIINGYANEYEKHFSDDEIREDLLPYMELTLVGEKVTCITSLEHIKGKSILVGLPIRSQGRIIGTIFAIKLASDYDMVINGFYIIFFSASVFSILLTLILLYYFTRKQIKPLVEMVQISNAMAGGDFLVRASEEGYGEVKELSNSLNSLGEKLQAADEKAKLYEQTRRDYIANISHELRTPISSIRAIAETLSDDMTVTKEKKTKYYLIILREARRLQKLINEMLDLSRLQSSENALGKTRVQGKKLIDEVQDYFEFFAEDTHIEFIVTSDAAQIPDFYSNESRILQILVILLDNAFKFAPQGGQVELDAKWNDEIITMSVSNTGEGIAPEDMEFIFDRFYKGDKSHNQSGSGLGLSLVKEIMRHLGEEIQVSSIPGEKTQFRFTLHRNEQVK